MTAGRALLKRLVVAAVVATVVVALGGIAPLLASGPGGDGVAAPPEQPEWDPSALDSQRLDNSGESDPEGDVGVVLIDRTHANRFHTEDVSPLVSAINDAGGEVQFTGSTGGLESELAKVDVLVVIDPAQRYDEEEVGEIRQFVRDGGHLLVLGEPNRKEVQQAGFFVALVTVRSELAALTSPFGISFGSDYVYDMENNDGNFKNVVTSPPSRTSADVVEGVGSVSMYTAATVSINRGTVLLRTAGTAERGGETADEGYPVAVLSRDGRVLAVGDKTFLNDQYHAVADNELFVQRIVEFMTGANHRPSDLDGDEETEERAAPSVGR